MTELADVAAERGIKYFLISFTDLFGAQRAKLVPAAAIAGMQKAGAGFAGFAAWLDMTPADPDLFAIPDPGSLVQLPWKREVGWLAADLVMRGEAVEQGPRNTLKRVVAAAAAQGLAMKSGVEAEFFLVTPDGQAISDAADTATKPCYDQGALLRRYDVIAEICDAMLELGWLPYQNDHEDANGQFEMNWQYDDALVTADRHSFFKFLVKSVAEKHGAARDVHAKTVRQPDRLRLPRACLAVARADQRVRRPRRRTRRVRGRLPLSRRRDRQRGGAVRRCSIRRSTATSG